MPPNAPPEAPLASDSWTTRLSSCPTTSSLSTRSADLESSWICPSSTGIEHLTEIDVWRDRADVPIAVQDVYSLHSWVAREALLPRDDVRLAPIDRHGWLRRNTHDDAATEPAKRLFY